MESVIAIGIVAILLTTFLAVFGPATQGIRRALSVQEADRLGMQTLVKSDMDPNAAAAMFVFAKIRPMSVMSPTVPAAWNGRRRQRGHG